MEVGGGGEGGSGGGVEGMAEVEMEVKVDRAGEV